MSSVGLAPGCFGARPPSGIRRAELVYQGWNRIDVTEPPAEGSKTGGLRSSPSARLGELYGLLEGTGLEYDLRPYTAERRITLLSAPPKRGKSTFAALYARAKATGSTFLDHDVAQGNVLYVAPDENWRDVVRRFRSFGTPGDNVHVWRDRGCSLDSIARRADEVGADLVVLDTLLRVAGIADENDNAEWDRWFGEARERIHASSAIWLALHHDRKSGGQDGRGIRGASAIFGSVDVAVSLQSSDESDRRRVLRVEGTRLDDAEPLVIEFDPDESEYKAVGEAEVISLLEDGALGRLRGILSEEPAPVASIIKKLRERHPEAEGDVAEGTVRNRLKRLWNAGIARQHGEGGQRDPYEYSLSHSTETVGTAEGDAERPSTHGPRGSGPVSRSGSETSHSVVQQPQDAERVNGTSRDAGSRPGSAPAVVDPADRGREAERF